MLSFFNMLICLTADYIKKIFFNFLNKLSSLLKFIKNNTTSIISNSFIFRTNYTISKSDI